jgi:hypothetical protein
MTYRPSEPPVSFSEVVTRSEYFYMYGVVRELITGLKAEDAPFTLSRRFTDNITFGYRVDDRNFLFGVGVFNGSPDQELSVNDQFLSLYTRSFNATVDNQFTNSRRSDDDPLRELNSYLELFNKKKSGYGILARHFMRTLLNDVDSHFHRCRLQRSRTGTYFECLFFNDKRLKRGRIYNLRVDVSFLNSPGDRP